MNYNKILKQLREDPNFYPPIPRVYVGRIRYGAPYFYPWKFNSTIIKVRKNKMQFSRLKPINIFRKYVYLGWPIAVKRQTLGWKDKWNTPRFEWSPAFHIFFFKWQYCKFWNAPDGNNDLYYEMYLWYKNYCEGDLNRAMSTWGWKDETGKSSWNMDYIKGDYYGQGH